MKNIKVTFSIFISITVFVVLATVVFLPRLTDNGKSNNKVFAENISISSSFREIDLLIDNSLSFTEIPYHITPKEYNLEVENRIVDSLGREKDNCTFSRSCFQATKCGCYYLRYIVKNKNNEPIYDTIKINVVDNIGESIMAVKPNNEISSIQTNQTIDLTELVTIHNAIENDVEFRAKDGTILSKNFSSEIVGNFEIKVSINVNSISISDTIKLNISQYRAPKLIIKDTNNNILANGDRLTFEQIDEIAMLNYSLDSQSSQTIMIEIQNEEVVEVFSLDAPIAMFSLKSTGTTNVTFFNETKTESITFTIFVE